MPRSKRPECPGSGLKPTGLFRDNRGACFSCAESIKLNKNGTIRVHHTKPPRRSKHAVICL